MNVEEHIKNRKPLTLPKRSVIHLMLVYHRIMDRFGAALKPYDLTLPQFNVLRILRGMDGRPANLGSLNERMVTPMSNTTRLVDKLIAKGFVTREVCPTNRRKIEILITAQGRDALDVIDPVIEQSEAALLRRLDESELQELNRLLDKFEF